MKKIVHKIVLGLLTLFLYAPIIYVIFFSFNSSKSLSQFASPSFRWYQNVFSDHGTLAALEVTIIIAIIATVVSVVVGTLASIGLNYSSKFIKKLVNQINNLPIMNPEIVTAVGLMLFFSAIHIEKGFWTLLLAHIAFCIPYVMLSVNPRVYQLDSNLVDAAMDLGATPWQALRKVIIPELMPGIVTGGLIAFTMSFDDFVISYFVSGNGVNNISTLIYTMSRRINPRINAISTIAILILTIGLLLFNWLRISKIKGKNTTKCTIVTILVIALGVGGLNVLRNKHQSSFNPIKVFGTNHLNVYNWGEYIDEKTIERFEQKYNVKVNYSMYSSNEEMYTKLLGKENVDILYPSDYMIKRLIDEKRLAKINHKNIPNLKHLDPGLKHPPYDPNLEYSVPYFAGSVGLVYNKKLVNKQDIERLGYNVLLDPKYRHQVYFYDSERDAFMVALKAQNLSMNTTNKNELLKAYKWLQTMKKNTDPVFVTDEVIDGMVNNNKAIALVYSGDASYILSQNKDMAYLEPKNGTNLWIDSMVIPRDSKAKKLAEAWINFNLSEKIARDNSIYVGYTSSVLKVKNTLSKQDFYGIDSYMYRQDNAEDEYFRYNKNTQKLVSELWVKVKAGQV